MIGRTLGNYRTTKQIGMGGMATVYKAYDPSMGQVCLNKAGAAPSA